MLPECWLSMKNEYQIWLNFFVSLLMFFLLVLLFTLILKDFKDNLIQNYKAKNTQFANFFLCKTRQILWTAVKFQVSDVDVSVDKHENHPYQDFSGILV